ncbi:MAG: glutaredoxin [Acidobacteria bacterium]|nr:MAG: glutaredoxin [Acidobacteriota bacterium]
MAKTVVLLTASWCPRCPIARRLWAGLRDRLGFDLRELDVDSGEGQDAASLWGISSVPAVIVDGELAGDVSDEARAMGILSAGETPRRAAGTGAAK